MDAESWVTQARKGLLELCILNFLRGESLYGYEIVKRLERVPGLVIAEGTIYPILSRFKADGLVDTYLQESDRGPVRKYYRLTPVGKRAVQDMNGKWEELKRAIAGIVEEVS